MEKPESFSPTCPYCGGEYQKGYVSCNGGMQWIPENKKGLTFLCRVFPERTGAPYLRKWVWNYNNIEARYCPTCQKIEMNVPEKKPVEEEK